MVRPGVLQHVFDELRQSLRLLYDDGERPATLVGRAYPIEEQRLTEHSNLCHGRPQLVRHARNEVCAQTHQFTFAPQLKDSDNHQPCRQNEQSHEQRNPIARKTSDNETLRCGRLKGNAQA